MKAPESLTLIARAAEHNARLAIVAREGEFSYRDLLDASHRIASALLEDEPDLREARVAYLFEPGFTYAAAQWGIWRAGGIAVPLPPFYPEAEIEYVLRDSEVSRVVVQDALSQKVSGLAARYRIRVLEAKKALAAAKKPLPAVEPRRRAQIFYTSGTTARPKGAVLTHANLEAQVRSLVEAWEWSSADRILNVLPLHHVHGVINVLTCALWSGAVCELMPRFDPGEVWGRIARGGLTLFMAVPTIYARLIRAWEEADPERREAMSQGARSLRLMVSGSAPLPVTVMERWREITGHVLLERYGMTEIGMALSNPLRGVRVPGSVGTPLPGVQVRLVDESGCEVPPGVPGEIEVRGPGVFLEYWGRPEATREAFRDGWFRTGDIGVLEEGRYRILGRKSVDIIKSGGYKISAVEIETALRGHPDIDDCAVVAVPDAELGEIACAAVVPRQGRDLDAEDLRQWLKERLAAYKVPRRFLVTRELPRNALGKVLKPELAARFS
ncbi:MAG: long-chain-fatty-acid--CoA ligase [Gemmatimonadales bacterium]|nr:MAG: long-chain-fatty-acid--CoA ligase [Gemmatimonadales bacterium]